MNSIRQPLNRRALRRWWMVAREALGPMADCLFCSIAAGTTPAHVVADEPDVLAFLDIRPVFKGHTLVVPRSHRDTFGELDATEVGHLFGTAQRVVGAIEQALGAGGAWVSLNDRVSQSVPHVHVHVVPRTKGDGLRGFYWPRTKYADDADAASYAARLRDAYRG